MRNKRSYWLFLLPSLLGVAFFYIVPFIYSFCYAVIDNMTSWEFVGLRHLRRRYAIRCSYRRRGTPCCLYVSACL